MIRINLLPHREEKRKARQQQIVVYFWRGSSTWRFISFVCLYGNLGHDQ